ncbi:hypothetical protein [Fimbriiglobus ruber]|uniref:Type II toxin-antitoxin system RelE/ParE family toxin n=1 Tax=Fimbriiglobus ruber TaxID=1908690 RepID=A0A225DHX4_9BACT|nr:hypothetical protein [Fimbriiglobus ruber]OWK38158.1 hypothetical protein FRUB_07278 [Fimbriiglobus ruber]
MTVEWEAGALERLADIYTEAQPAERETIFRCVERINVQLASDPWQLGESRGTGRRVWFAHPLMMAFDLPRGGGVVVNHVVKLNSNLAAE